MNIQLKRQINTKGFTLVEIVVAIGLVALLLSGVLGLMGVSAVKIDKSIAKKEGKAVAAAVELEVGALDVDSSGNPMSYDNYTPYNKLTSAAKWSGECDKPSGAILYYRYAGDPTENPKADGSMAPYDLRDGGIAGIDYVMRTEVRRVDETASGFKDDFDNWAIVGNVYLIKFRNYGPGDDGGLKFPGGPPEYGEDPDIDSGFASFQLEVFKLPLNGNGRYATLDNYLTEDNMNKYQDKIGSIRPVYKSAVGFRFIN